MDDFSALMARLTPEQLAQLMHIGSTNESDRLLEDQLADAQHLRDLPAQKHTTGLGAALGAAGDSIRSFGAGVQEGDARRKMEAHIAEREKARRLYAKLLGDPGQQQQNQDPQGASGPMAPFML